MASVPENLEKILQARYGEEVRGAIHDSIRDIYQYANGDDIDLMKRIIMEMDSYSGRLENITEGMYVSGVDGNHSALSSTKIIRVNVEDLSGNTIRIPISNATDIRGFCFRSSDETVINAKRYSSLHNDAIPDNVMTIIECQVPNVASYLELTWSNSFGDPNLYFGFFPSTSLLDLCYEFVKSFNGSFGFDEGWTIGKYLNANGELVDYGTNKYSLATSDFVKVSNYSKMFLLNDWFTVADYAKAIAFYDQGKHVLSTYDWHYGYEEQAGKRSAIHSVPIPGNAYYVRVSYRNNDANRIPLRLFRVWFDEPKKDLGYYYPGPISCFLNVGCIGDSLSSGESVSGPSGSFEYVDIYKHSWGQYLARMTGNTYHNWSSGGLTASGWLSSEHATECFDGEHLCECYTIGLGVNDANRDVTLGSQTDVGDGDSNPDTFYGNYGKIISKILKLQPKAKIFVFTGPSDSMESEGFNEAIRYMGTRFADNVFVIDLYDLKDEYSTITSDYNKWKGGHGNAISYMEMAHIIAREIDNYINANPVKFRDIQFIGTNYTW